MKSAWSTPCLEHPFVSRHHAQLALDPAGSFRLRDTGSRNGTLANGLLLKGTEVVHPGTLVITIGPYTLTALSEALPEDATVSVQVDPPVKPRRVTVDRDLRLVRVDGRVVIPKLSVLEYRLLEILDTAAPAAVASQVIGDHVWGEGQWDAYMLHNLLGRLRKKLAEGTGTSEELLVSIPGFGYRLG